MQELQHLKIRTLSILCTINLLALLTFYQYNFSESLTLYQYNFTEALLTLYHYNFYESFLKLYQYNFSELLLTLYQNYLTYYATYFSIHEIKPIQFIFGKTINLFTSYMYHYNPDLKNVFLRTNVLLTIQHRSLYF